jgi:hypothetical protein
MDYRLHIAAAAGNEDDDVSHGTHGLEEMKSRP